MGISVKQSLCQVLPALESWSSQSVLRWNETCDALGSVFWHVIGVRHDGLCTPETRTIITGNCSHKSHYSHHSHYIVFRGGKKLPCRNFEALLWAPHVLHNLQDSFHKSDSTRFYQIFSSWAMQLSKWWETWLSWSKAWGHHSKDADTGSNKNASLKIYTITCD